MRRLVHVDCVVFVNSLERRVLLASAEVVNRQLIITGTSGDDQITIGAAAPGAEGGQAFEVTDGLGFSFVFSTTTVKSIVVNSGSGNDLVDLRVLAGIAAGVIAGDGNDVVYGSAGNEWIMLGDGNDWADGQGGEDEIFGDGGNDRLFGDTGRDTLRGGSGRDAIWGGDDNDRIYGNGGADTLRGDNANDLVEGNAGNDRLYGCDNDNTVRGGDGDDVFFCSGIPTLDLVDGGSGNDRATVNTNDTVSNVETVIS